MPYTEYLQHKISEYTILKKAALNAENWFMAEYYGNMIKDTTKELLTLI